MARNEKVDLIDEGSYPGPGAAFRFRRIGTIARRAMSICSETLRHRNQARWIDADKVAFLLALASLCARAPARLSVKLTPRKCNAHRNRYRRRGRDWLDLARRRDVPVGPTVERGNEVGR